MEKNFFFLKCLRDLIFPNICLHCHQTLNDSKESLCITCFSDLVFSDFAQVKGNIAYTRIFHFTDIYRGGCLLFFEKGNVAQSLIHELKYHGNQDIGIYLGKLIGENLFLEKDYKDVDQIIPVPLHPKKRKKRGYNQAEIIAKGIANNMGVDVAPNILIRKKHTETQTHKTAEERIENMKDVFAIKDANLLSKKHILVVDDVLTTGATLSNCIEILKQHTSAKISFYCVALAI